jgi:hypothetical protein
MKTFFFETSKKINKQKICYYNEGKFFKDGKYEVFNHVNNQF